MPLPAFGAFVDGASRPEPATAPIPSSVGSDPVATISAVEPQATFSAKTAAHASPLKTGAAPSIGLDTT